jgi:hypothetical protein
MKTLSEQNNEVKMAVSDINDVFEQILLSEERISEESYKQGFSKGVSDGNLEVSENRGVVDSLTRILFIQCLHRHIT